MELIFHSTKYSWNEKESKSSRRVVFIESSWHDMNKEHIARKIFDQILPQVEKFTDIFYTDKFSNMKDSRITY